MTPALIQFLVAGALVVAWTWMLGRPLLARLSARIHRGSPSRAVPLVGGHDRAPEGLAGPDRGQPRRWTAPGIAPIAEWRAQPLPKRRLQIMLGFAFATFCSALLAIALRGPFVRLFLLTAACFGLHLIVAAYIGSRELRLVEAARPDRVAAIGRRAVRTTGLDAERAPVASDDPVDLLSGNGIEGGLFDEGFFEPIAELGPRTLDGPPTAPDRSIFDPVPSVDEPSGEPVEKPEQPAEEIAAAEAAPPADAGIDGEAAEPTFTAPPARRSRPPRRDKGRPIYVEPPAAEGDASIRAVND